MSEKVTAIEQNIEKNNRRLEIASQAVNWLKRSKATELMSATLPAEHWYGEHILANLIESACLPNLNKVTFHGVEFDRQVALKSIKNMPEGAMLVNSSLHYLMTRQVVERECGIGYINEDERDTNKPYNFVWADYCGLPNKDLLRHVGEYMSRMNEGMFYVTFALRSRQKNGLAGVCKKVGLSKKDPVASIIVKLRETAPKAKLVYNVQYRGGKLNTTDMVTIGFVIGKCSPNSVGVIVKDTRGNETRKRNGQTYQRYKNDPKLFNGRKPIGRKPITATGSKTTPEQKIQIRELLDKGMDNQAIAEKVGVSLRCVGSVSAHHNHPEAFKFLREKRGANNE